MGKTTKEYSRFFLLVLLTWSLGTSVAEAASASSSSGIAIMEERGYPLPSAPLCAAEVALRRAAVLAAPQGYKTVGANCEYKTIGAALAAPDDGRRIICVMDAVHREAGIRVAGIVTIIGFGAGETVIEAASSVEEASDRVLEVAAGGRAYVRGLTLRCGKITTVPRRGGGVANSGELLMEDCAVVENRATYGVGVWTEGKLTLRRCVIARNKGIKRPPADQYSGVDCGGGGAGLRIEKGGLALVENSLIAFNEAVSAGGGLHVSCEGRARLVDSVLFGNVAAGRGGGVDLAGGILELELCSIAGNRAREKGQALFNRGKLSLRGCLLAAEAGGAYFLGEDKGGEFGIGELLANEANYCQSGPLAGAAGGAPGILRLSEARPGMWNLESEKGSPAAGFGRP
ncbi:MAG: hypothetical protein JNG85_08175 [Spirochaetaceae bacterium]|nr:hypothetical protein [Spirochaetaceae bacterium]